MTLDRRISFNKPVEAPNIQIDLALCGKKHKGTGNGIGIANGRRMSIAKHTTYNLIGSIVPLLLALATIPLYLGLVGPERYGALAIAWLILGYFGLFDLGLGRATAQRIAALKNASAQERSDVFWTAVVVNIAMGIVGGIIMYFAAQYFFQHIFKIDEQLRFEAMAAVPFLAAAVPVATLTGVASGALQGREKFLEVNLATIVGTSLFQLLPLGIAWIVGPTLKWLILAAVVARVIGLLIFLIRVHSNLLAGIKPHFDAAHWVGLFKYGGWVSVTSAVSPLLLSFDRMMIGGVLGARAVTFYSVPVEIVQRISVIPLAMGSALFPRFVNKDSAGQTKLQNKAISSLTVLVAVPTLGALLLLEPFLILWVGNDFAQKSSVIGLIALLGFWIRSFAVIPFSRLQAIGRPDLVAKWLLIQLPFYVIAVYFGLIYWGLIGAVIVFSMRRLVDFQILFYLSERCFSIPKPIFVHFFILAVGFLIASAMPVTNPVRWLCSIALLAGTIILCVRTMPAEMAELIVDIAPRPINSIIERIFSLLRPGYGNR
ncbi:MAG: flippase [Sphingorhabdus sp.]